MIGAASAEVVQPRVPIVVNSASNRRQRLMTLTLVLSIERQTKDIAAALRSCALAHFRRVPRTADDA
jgi:hypothetical protein